MFTFDQLEEAVVAATFVVTTVLVLEVAVRTEFVGKPWAASHTGTPVLSTVARTSISK
jgi:hypothetical protein